jgi:hypothetical protein
MKTAYLVYLGWNLAGLLAAIGFGLFAAGGRMGDLTLVAMALTPFVALGGLAGLALVAIVHRGCGLPSALTGSAACAGEVAIIAILGAWAGGAA